MLIVSKFSRLLKGWILVLLGIILSSSKLYSQNFDPIQMYEIVKISVLFHGQIVDVCNHDGSIYGELHFGRYKKDKYYFAIMQDDERGKTNLSLFESISESPYADLERKGTKYIVKDMEDYSKVWKCYLQEFTITHTLQFMMEGSNILGQKYIVIIYTLKKK